MALDPDISLRLTPLQSSGSQFNPLDLAKTWLGLQQGMVGLQQAQNQLMARQRASQIIASSPDFDSAATSLSKDPMVAGFAPEMVSQYVELGNALRSRKLTETQTQGQQQSQYRDAFSGAMSIGLSAAAQPDEASARKVWNDSTSSYLATLPTDQAKAVKPMIQGLTDSVFAKGHDLGTIQNMLIAAGHGAGMSMDQLAGYAPDVVKRQYGEAGQYGIQRGALLGGGNAGALQPLGPMTYNAQAPGQAMTPGGPVPKVAIPPQPVGGAENELGAGTGQTAGPGSVGAPAGNNGLGAPALGVPQGQIVLPPGARATQPQPQPSATGGTASQAPVTGGGFSVKFDPAVDKPPPTVGGGNAFQQSQQTTQSLNVANKMREDFQSPAALDKFNADNVALSQLHQLNVHLNSLASSGGFLTPGAEAAKRLGVANIVQTVANIFGGDVSPEFKKNIADATASQKLTLQFATNMAKATTRGPEAYNTISSFYSAVPGIENTPLASMFVSASIESQVKREIDLRNFQNDWLHYYPSLEGSTEAFAARPGTSERAYTQRALEPLGIKPDGSGFQSKEAVIDNARKGLITRDDALQILKKDPQFSKEIQQGQ